MACHKPERAKSRPATGAGQASEWFMVEVPGIATRVLKAWCKGLYMCIRFFGSRPAELQPAGSVQNQPLIASSRLQGRTQRDHPAVGRLPHPQARIGRRAALVRQRVPILNWQLSVVGFLRGRPTNLDTPPLPDVPKSRLFTPVFYWKNVVYCVRFTVNRQPYTVISFSV